MVDVEGVVRVLDGGHLVAEPRQMPHQLFDQRGLAGILEAGNADDVHAPLAIISASARSSGVLMLKKGVMWHRCPDHLLGFRTGHEILHALHAFILNEGGPVAVPWLWSRCR